MSSRSSYHMSGYQSACEAHPELKSFDSSLQERTIKVIDSVTIGSETGTGFSSQHEIHMEVTKHLVEVSQDVANMILESEDDVWENIPLRSLVKAYFENTMKTLEIFDNVMECVEKAELGELVIQEVVAQFDKESVEKDLGGEKKKYEKTLKYLKKFKAMGDPFTGRELTTQLKLIKEQQESLLKEVSETKKKIDEEIEKVAAEIASKKKWMFWSNVIFGVAAFAVAIASIALIVIGPTATAGIVLAGTLVIKLVPTWISVEVTLKNKIDDLKLQLEALEKQKDELSSVEVGAETNEEALKPTSVSELVDALEKKISSNMKHVNDAIDNEGDEVDTKLAMHSMRDKVKKITEKLQELGESVDSHSKLIREARLHVLEKINGVGKYHHG